MNSKWTSRLRTTRIDFDQLDVEAIAAEVHEAWMEAKREDGITSRLSETGEELMVPFELLSEQAKDLDRVLVKTVLKAVQTVYGS